MEKKNENVYVKLFELKKRWIKLERDTSGYNYKYATLDQIQDKLSPVLEELKLLIVHKIQDDELITIIMDIESGEQEQSSIKLTTTKAQERWSEITYYRRYNLLALLDLKTEDDDWKKASSPTAPAKAVEKDSTFWKTNWTGTNLKSFVSEMELWRWDKDIIETIDYIRSKYIISEDQEKVVMEYHRAWKEWRLKKPLNTNTTK